MKSVGIDYGSKQIGLAVSNDEGTIAFPRKVIQNDLRAISVITQLVREEKAQRIIMGDTRAVSGRANTVTEKRDSFAEALSAQTGINVESVWEGWSSREASRYAGQRAKDDSSAAAIILQRYLDGIRKGA